MTIHYNLLRRIRDAAFRKYVLGYTIDDIMVGKERDDEFFLIHMKSIFPEKVKEIEDVWKIEK